jgi:DNA-directed RNA polymerase III subunit RPC2
MLVDRRLSQPGSALVFLNGHILGVHCRPELFAHRFRTLRRAARVGCFVSIYVEPGRCHIAADGGRVCRPLIIADAGVPRVTSEHMQVITTLAA